MRGATLHGMQMPAANAAVGDDRPLDRAPLWNRQQHGLILHASSGHGLPRRFREMHAAPTIDPATRIARQPGAVGRPCEEVGEWSRLGDGADVGHDWHTGSNEEVRVARYRAADPEFTRIPSAHASGFRAPACHHKHPHASAPHKPPTTATHVPLAPTTHTPPAAAGKPESSDEGIRATSLEANRIPSAHASGFRAPACHHKHPHASAPHKPPTTATHVPLAPTTHTPPAAAPFPPRSGGKLPVKKALHGLFPLERPQETPRVSWVAGRRILLGQTCSTVC